MIVSSLKFVATILVYVGLGLYWAIRFIIALFTEGTTKAAKAAPGVGNQVKSHARATALSFPSKVGPIEARVRKFVGLTKTPTPQPRRMLELNA